jgi:hypothetical protein
LGYSDRLLVARAPIDAEDMFCQVAAATVSISGPARRVHAGATWLRDIDVGRRRLHHEAVAALTYWTARKIWFRRKFKSTANWSQRSARTILQRRLRRRRETSERSVPDF